MLKRYGVGKKDVWYSIIYGGLVGLLGVVAFVIFLKVDWKQEQIDVLAPVEEQAATPSEVRTFYAMQHGVFSSEEQAQKFLSTNPAFTTAVAVPVDGRYYVWSRIASATGEMSKPSDGVSFIKSFQLEGGSCTEETLRTLPKWLASENSLKFNFGDEGDKGVLPKDWESVRTTAVGISEDMDVARLHLVLHYISSSNCLNIKFD